MLLAPGTALSGIRSAAGAFVSLPDDVVVTGTGAVLNGGAVTIQTGSQRRAWT